MKIINEFLKEARSFEKKDSVKVIIYDPEKKILILRRQMGEGGEGQWDIAGGAIERGENQIDAAKRESFEETGLHIEKITKVKSLNLKIPEKGINSTMHIYMANSIGTDVLLKSADWPGSGMKPEHSEVKWVSKKSELENLPMLDELKKVVMSHLK